MKRVFYFKLSNLTYLKQEVESTTREEGAVVQETFVYFISPIALKGPILTLLVSRKRTYLLSKDLLEKDGSYTKLLCQNYRRITRRTFKNKLKKVLTQVDINFQSI